MSQNHKPRSFIEYLALGVLWNEIFSAFIQYAFLLLSEIQCLSILFWHQFNYLTSQQDLSLSQKLAGISNILNFETQDSYGSLLETLLILTWLYMFIFMITILFLIVSYSRRKLISSSQNLSLVLIGQFHLTFGFWITSIILMTTLKDGQSEKLSFFGGAIDPYFINILHPILIIFNYVCGSFFAIFSYDPFTSSNALSAHSTNFQVLNFIMKAILVPIQTFLSTSDDINWTFIVLSLCISLVKYYDLIRVFPYYKITAMKTTSLTSLFAIIASITGFIAAVYKIYSELSATTLFCMNILMVPLIILYWRNFFKTLISESLKMRDDQLLSEEMVLKKLFCLNDSVKKLKITGNNEEKTQLNELRFWGLFTDYNNMKLNTNDDLPYTPGEMNINNRETTKDLTAAKVNDIKMLCSNFIDQVIQETLKNFSMKLKHSDKLKIILAYHFIEKLESPSTPVYYLSALSKVTGLKRIAFLSLHQKIQNRTNGFFKEKEDQVLDIKHFLDLEAISTKLIEMIHSNSKSYLEFWSTYNKAELKVNDLYVKSQEIEDNSEKIRNFWTKVIETNWGFAGSLSVVYSIYLTLVRNSPASANKIYEKYRWLEQAPNFEKEESLTQKNLNSYKNITFKASMARDKLGKIVHVSPNITELLGWTSQSLLRGNINLVLPNFMQEGHNRALAGHLDKVTEAADLTRLYSTIDSFITDKVGYIYPCQVYISLSPEIQDELTYITIIRMKDLRKSQILLGEDGYLEGFTKDLAKKLYLSPDKRIHFKDICENYSELKKINKNEISSTLPDTPGLEKQKSNKNRRQAKSPFLKGKNPNDASEEDEFLKTIEQTKSNVLLKLRNAANLGLRHNKVTKEYYAEFKRIRLWGFSFFTLSLTPAHPASNEGVLLKNVDMAPVVKDEEEEEEVPEEKLQTDNAICLSPVLSPQARLLSNEDNYESKYGGVITYQRTESFLITKFATKENIEALHTDEQISIGLNSDPFFKAKAHDNKKFRKMIQHGDAVDASSVTSVQNYNSKIEHAVNMIPRETHLRVVNFIVVLFIITTAITLILFQAENITALTLIEGNIDIMSTSAFRLAKLVELARVARYVVLADVGFMTNARYASLGVIADLKVTMLGPLANLSRDVNVLNNDIRESIYKIEDNLQEELYRERLPVFELSDQGKIVSNRTANPFDLITEIVATSNRITSIPPASLGFGNREIAFLLNNTLDGLLLAGENIASTLLEDNSVKLQGQITFVTTPMICMGVIGLIILCFFYNIQKDFKKRRDHFIDILLLLGKDQISKEIDTVQKFTSFLEKNDMDSKKINLKIDQEYFMLSSANKPPEKVKFSKKQANLGGINNNLVKLLIASIIFICLLLSIYLILLLMTISQKSIVSTKVGIMARSNDILYKFKLIRTIIYQYIQENGHSTIRNQPIQEEWDSLYSDLTTAQDFFLITLLDNQNGIGDDPELVQVVRGSLCSSIPLNPGPITGMCKTLAAGVLETGIVGLNSYMLNSLNQIKSSFDASARTFADMAKAANSKDLIIMDIMEFYFSYPVFELIDGLTKTRVKNDLSTFKISFQGVIISYVIISMIIGNFIWYLIAKTLGAEIVRWRKMLRQIPYEVLIHNKLLISYVMKDRLKSAHMK